MARESLASSLRAALPPGAVRGLHSFNRVQETEADWLAASLLLPCPILVYVKTRFSELEEGARHFRVSLAMLRYRLDVTGVNYQFGR